jgi:phage terminase large subunit-like protein
MTTQKSWPPRFLSPTDPADLARSRGDHVIDFAQALCTITKDSIAGNAGSPLVFRDWQKELTRHLYAEKEDGTLRHSRALIGVSRKNGKSAWLSSLVLEHLIFGVSGGEAYSAAADKEQSKIIFNTVRDMVKNAPDLSDFLTVYKE